MERPLILVTPHTEKDGTEPPDTAVRLSNCYAEAVLAARGLPLILPCIPDPAMIREAVGRADGVLISGGEDVAPHLYTNAPLPPDISARVVPTVGGRDLFELIVIDEVFRQAKPLLAICRGQQIVNVALGGDLIADLALQCPQAARHDRQAERRKPVHEVEVAPDSLLARVTGLTRLGVNSTHHQAVGRVAPPLRVTGRSPDGVVEALELDATHADALPFFLAVQFHPERLHDRHSEHARLFAALIEAAGSRRRPAGEPRPGAHPTPALIAAV